jgi:DDE_Tnp_1-associated
MERFRACFGDLVDPRTGNARRHDLLEILLIAIASMVCGAESCVDMAVFGRAKAACLGRFLRLEGGIPSHDTFSQGIRLFDPRGWLPAPTSVVDAERHAFEASFGRFVAAFADPAGTSAVVAVDGKTARRSFDRQGGRRALHMVSAWAVGRRLVLGQRKVDGDSNEIATLPELLALRALEGRIVTASSTQPKCNCLGARTGTCEERRPP